MGEWSEWVGGWVVGRTGKVRHVLITGCLNRHGRGTRRAVGGLEALVLDAIRVTDLRVGGWVGGWVGDREVEEEQAVGMRCCRVWEGGRVGGWVGGLFTWLPSTYTRYSVKDSMSIVMGAPQVAGALACCLGGWEGGWVDGWA